MYNSRKYERVTLNGLTRTMTQAVNLEEVIADSDC